MTNDDEQITIRITTEDSPEEMRAKMSETTPSQREQLLARIKEKQRDIKESLDNIVEAGDSLIEDYEALERVANVIENFDTLTSKLN